MDYQEEIKELIESTNTPSNLKHLLALDNIAKSIVENSARVEKGQKVLIWFDKNKDSVHLIKLINEYCKKKGADVRYFMRDMKLDAKTLRGMNKDQIFEYFRKEKGLVDWAEQIIMVRGSENPEVIEELDEDGQKSYQDAYSDVHKRRIKGEVDWQLFLWPTAFEAKIEKVDPETYTQEVIDACDQPWEEIYKAQEKLVEILDNGKKLTLIANENDPDPKRRTHVEMSIDGMTFVNSTIHKNFPGSEVFSAPVLESVNGQIFAKGEYMYAGHLMEDMYFRIENGKIIEAEARIGNDGLQSILNTNEFSRYFGEVALGTNGGLKRRFFNPLLNEKLGGSFHMAIGYCYTFDNDWGQKFNINNGNVPDRVPIHWDVTIIMRGDGKVIVDDQIIQQDGHFIDPSFSVLNPK